MGHTVSDAAARSVKKGEKKAEKAARTDDQIFVDMEKLLDAHLSVTPTDIRLLLTRYKEAKNLVTVLEAHSKAQAHLGEAIQKHDEELEAAVLVEKSKVAVLDEIIHQAAVELIKSADLVAEVTSGSQEESTPRS